MNPNNASVVEKSKVTRKKKPHNTQTEKPAPTLTISAYEIEQLRRTEAKMLHRLHHLKKRVKHFEKKFHRSVTKPEIPRTNKSCEAIGVYDTAVQTEKTARKEEIENLKDVIEKLYLKIVELMEISKVNQLVNVDSSTLQSVEFSRCLNHLEKRMDRLGELLHSKRTPCMRLMSNFALEEFGHGDQLQENSVEQLFLRSTEKIARKNKKLQSIVIVNEPICSDEPNNRKSNRSVRLQTSESVASVKKKKKKHTCCGCFFHKNKSNKNYYYVY